VYEGVRRFFTTERLEQELASGLGTFPASAPDALLRFQRLDLDPPAEPILEALDGTRPLVECLTDPRWERRQALPVLYTVFVTGVVDLFDRSNPTPAPRSHRRRMERYGAGAVDGLSGAKLEEFLASEVMQLKGQDHFRALGLTRGATSTEIEQAYDQLAWRYHPDVFAAHPASVLELAESLFDRLKAAYVVLRSPVRRESYLAQLGEGR
jgi:DnaJ-domain-containing protein 1